MESERAYLVLGLDPGIASCGFCLLDMTNHKILEMGSRLFKTPQEDKTKVSLAVTRRNARSARRNNERTKSRMKHCMDILADEGLIPEDADKTWFQSKKGDKPILKLRSCGLNRALTDREFAQVLYSLCGHRGYIPHGEGKDAETDDAEGKKVLNAIKRNTEEMAAGGYRTVGEMLHSRGKSRNRGGNYDFCVYNSQIQSEVHAIFEAQRALGNLKANEKFEDRYLECLTWEKKSSDHDKKVYDQVGTCIYFPELKRAADADVSSELCRAYEKLGHLVIVHVDGAEQRLTGEQISHYIGILFSPTPLNNNKYCKVTYSTIRSDLDLSGKSVFKGVPQEKEKDEVFVPKAWRCLRKVLANDHEDLLDRMLNDRELGDAICEALTFSSSETSLQEQLEPLGLAEDECVALSSIPFNGKLFKGYGSRSIKALSILLGAFEEPGVQTLADAEKATGLDRKRLEDRVARSELLPPYNTYDETCRNPVVLRAMGQMRHIVNAIIRIYGVPDEIHIELGRELKMSAREKEMVSKRQRANETANKNWAAIAAKILCCEPEEVPGQTIRKLAFREEQGEKDIYTNAPIDLEKLVTDNRYCEIDHVLPYSRTCDDSRANKVLVLSASNQNKRERTPYEWMSQDAGKAGTPKWSEYSARVIATVKNPRKRANLLNMDLDKDAESEFLQRNLNDTRYMSVAVKNYLEDCLQFPDDGRKTHVIAVAGGATASLRHVWGLNFGKNNEKDRTDNRHHAVDAAVIAACSTKTVQAVARASSVGRESFKHIRQSRLADTQPWKTFAEDVITERSFVIPTYMADHGVTGCVFEDFSYSLEGIDEKGYAHISRQTDRTTGECRSLKASNFEIVNETTVKLLDSMAFLRLWHDPHAGKTGRWYIEPVYCADIPNLDGKTYHPRYQKQKVARSGWPLVPAEALKNKPLLLFRGDVLIVGNHIARYWKFDIGGGKVTMLSIVDINSEAKGFPSISKWKNDMPVRILSEDCLASCYKHMTIDSENSTFEER